MIANHEVSRNRHLCQPRQLFIVKNIKMVWAHCRNHFSKGSAWSYDHALCDGVIMVTAYNARCLVTYPFNAGNRIGGIIH